MNTSSVHLYFFIDCTTPPITFFSIFNHSHIIMFLFNHSHLYCGVFISLFTISLLHGVILILIVSSHEYLYIHQLLLWVLFHQSLGTETIVFSVIVSSVNIFQMSSSFVFFSVSFCVCQCFFVSNSDWFCASNSVCRFCQCFFIALQYFRYFCLCCPIWL